MQRDRFPHTGNQQPNKKVHTRKDHPSEKTIKDNAGFHMEKIQIQ